MTNHVSKRLLVVCPTDTWGGVEKNVHLRVKALLERGHQVALIMLKNTFEDRFIDCPGLTVIHLNRRPSDLLPFIYRQYWRTIISFKPDCVFVPLKRDWWAATAMAYLARVPRTILYLGIQRRIKNNLKYRLLFGHFQAQLLVNSQWLMERATSTHPLLTDRNTHLIYNGFTLPKHPASKVQSMSGSADQDYIIGCAGRLSQQKGFDLLPDILKHLPLNCKIIVAGEGAERKNLEDLYARRGVDDRITLLGHVAPMRDFYEKLDAFLLPSRNEGMANVLNEAMSFGLPIVASNAPGCAELLEASLEEGSEQGYSYGKHGILTAIENTEAMALGLTSLITGHYRINPEIQRQKIANRHSLKQMIDQTEKLFFSSTNDARHQDLE